MKRKSKFNNFEYFIAVALAPFNHGHGCFMLMKNGDLKEWYAPGSVIPVIGVGRYGPIMIAG